MFHRAATDLTKVPKDQVKQWLDSFDAVLTDCDGKLSAIGFVQNETDIDLKLFAFL